jgi:transposase
MSKVSKELKSEIIEKIKGGQTVNEVSASYGVNRKTVYSWLSSKAEKNKEVLAASKLRRENEALREIIGRLVYEQELAKKNWIHK